MAELFAAPGGSANVGIAAPNLQGIFVPSADSPEFIDGFRLVVPLGGGKTSRISLEYGISAEVDSESTLLDSLINAPGTNVSYNFEGLVGPQGPPGPRGPSGIIGIFGMQGYASPAGVIQLDDTLQQVSPTWVDANSILYASQLNIFWYGTWEKMDIANVNSWNESSINNDGSFLVITADTGIYYSTDGGNSWNQTDPNGESYIQTNCADSGGKAVVLGEDSRQDGKILVTNNSGQTWTEKIVSE